MIRRILYLIVGVLLYISSTPVGMAQETISNQTRADFFAITQAAESCSYEISNEETASQGQNLPTSVSENGALPIGEALVPQSVPASPANNSGQENESKQKKQSEKNAKRLEERKARTRLSLTLASKGNQRTPLDQDAQQERTATIRFLHLAAVIDC